MIIKTIPDSSKQRIESEKPGIIAVNRHFSRNRINKFVAINLISFGLSGCATFYLHSDSDQKAMEAAIEGYSTANTAQTKTLEEQGKVLATQMQEERTAIVTKQLALRDNQIVQWIDNPDDQNNPTYGIRAEIGNRASYLLIDGNPVASDPENGLTELQKAIPDGIDLSEQRQSLRTFQQSITDAQKSVSKAIARYEAANGKTIKYCDKNGQGLSPAPPEISKDALKEYNDISDGCKELAQKVNLAKQYEKVLPDSHFLKVVFGYAPTKLEGNPPKEILNGALYQTARRAKAMKGLLDASTALQKTTKSQFELLEQQYQCELKRENAPGVSEQTKKLAQQIKEFSILLDNKDLQNQLTALPDDNCPEVKSVADTKTCGKPDQYAIPDLKALLCRAGIKPKDLKQAINSAASSNSTAAVLEGLREGKAKFEQGPLGRILNGLANTKPGEKPTDINARVAVAVVDALTPLNRLKQVHDGTLPDTPGVLIELARAEYDVTLAAAETARLRKESDIVTLELAAMINEVNLLNSAMKETDAIKALRRYSDSWTMGRLQQDVAVYDIENLKYEASLIREKAAVTANHKLLEPALVQLDTYAKGGWTAEDFRTILQALSVVALGVIGNGVN